MQHWSVRRRVVIAFIFGAAVPLIVFGGLLYWRTAGLVHDIEAEVIAARAVAARQVLRQHVGRQRSLIRDYSVWDEFHVALGSDADQWVRDNVTERVPANGVTDMVAVYDTKGHVLARGGDAAPRSLWLSDEVQAARRGKTSADLVRIGRRLYVLAAAPVVAQTRPSRPAGILVFGQAVTGEVLEAVGRLMGGKGDLAVHVVAEASATAGSSATGAAVAVRPSAHEIGEAFIEGGHTSQLVELQDGDGTTVALLKVSVPRDTYATALSEINVVTVVGLVAALLIATVVAILAAQTLGKPLRRLVTAATAMADGDLRQELPTERGDEIGIVAQAFNRMSQRVSARIDGLSIKAQKLALEISNLSAFGATLAKTPDPHAELLRLADMMRAMLDADTASVFLIHESRLTRAAFSGGKRSPVPSPAAEEIAAWVLEHAQGIEVPNAGTDVRLSPSVRGPARVHSFLAVPLARKEGVVGALCVGFCERHEFGPEELPLLTTIGGQIAIALQSSEAYEQLDRLYLETVTALAAAMEAKDQYTASHADALAAMAVAVGGRMGLTDEELRMLQYAAVLHDIGKIGIPGSILNKPSKLTREEFDTMAQHTIIGERIISRIDHLVPIASTIRSGHERWDGAGYPDGLRGDEIPLASRILLVCDAFDAMTTDRPYREALPVQTALEELAANAGSQFDPRVVDVFLASYPFR